MSEKSRSEFEERLVEHAAQNPEFRKALINDPQDAISTLLGMSLPESVSIVVHEEDENTLHFVLPPTEGALSNSELLSVSGGVCWSDCSCEDYESPRLP